jgi:Tfp pilus assembly protein PilF
VSRLAPDSWESATARAFIAYLLGDVKSASDLCDAAVQKNNRNADIFYLKGLTLLKRGRAREAKILFQRALEIDPNHIDSKKLCGT